MQKKGRGSERKKGEGGISVRKSIFYFQRPRSLEVGFSRTRGSQLIYIYIQRTHARSYADEPFIFFPHPDPRPKRESLAPKAEQPDQIGASNEQHRLINPLERSSDIRDTFLAFGHGLPILNRVHFLLFNSWRPNQLGVQLLYID